MFFVFSLFHTLHNDNYIFDSTNSKKDLFFSENTPPSNIVSYHTNTKKKTFNIYCFKFVIKTTKVNL